MTKVYLSRKFYEGECLSALAPEIELSALESLKASLLNREEYEVVQIVQARINTIQDEQVLGHYHNLLRQSKTGK